jgi:hypothetical protein
LRCPPPWTTALEAEVNGRRWFYEPGPTALPYTDADALCEAVSTVMASRRRRDALDDSAKERDAYGIRRRLMPSHP